MHKYNKYETEKDENYLMLTAIHVFFSFFQRFITFYFYKYFKAEKHENEKLGGLFE